MVGFEWDPVKEVLNVRKHGVDFTTASLIWDSSVVERVDNREYGEVRFQAFGVAESRVLTVIYTWRGQTRRIISARRSSRREQSFFETQIQRVGRPPQD